MHLQTCLQLLKQVDDNFAPPFIHRIGVNWCSFVAIKISVNPVSKKLKFPSALADSSFDVDSLKFNIRCSLCLFTELFSLEFFVKKVEKTLKSSTFFVIFGAFLVILRVLLVILGHFFALFLRFHNVLNGFLS